MTDKYFTSESDFQKWVMESMATQDWDVQEHRGDDRYPGVPDLSGATCDPEITDVWAELKMPRKLFTVHDLLTLEHPLTAQQRFWLNRRQARSGTFCGVLLPFRVGIKDEFLTYVSWVPVGYWLHWNAQPLMTWVLRSHTARISWLDSGAVRWSDLIRGRLTPGHGDRGQRSG
jgi:hypothetical protein